MDVLEKHGFLLNASTRSVDFLNNAMSQEKLEKLRAHREQQLREAGVQSVEHYTPEQEGEDRAKAYNCVCCVRVEMNENKDLQRRSKVGLDENANFQATLVDDESTAGALKTRCVAPTKFSARTTRTVTSAIPVDFAKSTVAKTGPPATMAVWTPRLAHR